MSTNWAIIFNKQSGSADDGVHKQVITLFKAKNIEPQVYFCGGEQSLEELVALAIKNGAGTIVAAGGDGTISGITNAILKFPDIHLGVLPLGTFNNFAKTLGIPLDITQAVAILLQENHTRIDVGEVNGQVFINNSGIGVYPYIVRNREWLQSQGISKHFALFLSVIKALFYCPFFHLDFFIDGHKLSRRTPLVFVGNNEYSLTGSEIGTREHLNKRTLSLFITHNINHLRFLGLILALLFRKKDGLTTLDTLNIDEFTIVSKKSHLRVSLDGEITKLNTPLHYRIRPKALSVISI